MRERDLYHKWHDMKRRCHDPDNKSYKWYGARGIKVCNEWKELFGSFYDWALANGYEKGLQIDRINNDGDYEPDNCRFVTNAVNVQNSTSAKLTMETATEIRRLYESGVPVKELQEMFSIGRNTAYSVVSGDSWKVDDYKKEKRPSKRLSEHEKARARKMFKEGATLKSLCEQFQVNKSTMHYILHKREKAKVDQFVNNSN